MDQNANRVGQQCGTSETVSRKLSWSEKLNKLTNNTFSRRRPSYTNVSSESLTCQPQRSYIPAPSLSSHNSSYSGGFGPGLKDHSDLSGTEKTIRKPSSTANTRRHTQQGFGSTSSFFDSNDSGPLYPREFLDGLCPGLEKKENARLAEEACLSQDVRAEHSQQSSSPDVSNRQSSNTNESAGTLARPDRPSETSTQSHIKKSRRISGRFAPTSLFRQQHVRHSIAAIPLLSPTKPKDGESTVKIEERRLMAPINPPLPRSTTMGPLNDPTAHSHQYSSPGTPSFMRPTSSSAARRSTISNAYKSPPTPLTLASGQRTADISGFCTHRERKRAAHDAAMTIGSRRVSEESTPGFLPSNGPQIMARNGLCAVQERGKLMYLRL